MHHSRDIPSSPARCSPEPHRTALHWCVAHSALDTRMSHAMLK